MQIDIETKEREIRGRMTRTTQFPALRAVALMRKLAPAFDAAGGRSNGIAAILDPALYPDLLRNTVVQLERDGVTIQETPNKPETIDMLFSGRMLPALFETIQFVIETNFADFLEAPSATATPTAPAP